MRVKSIVCVKRVPDTEARVRIAADGKSVDAAGAKFILNPYDEFAVEAALKHKEVAGAGDVTVVSVGDSGSAETLRTALAMGADSAVLVTDASLAGSDMVQTARVLAAAIEKIGGVDLVVAGNEATDGRGGMIPAMVAEVLGLPVLPGLDMIEIAADRVSGTAGVDGGTLQVSSSLPAVVSVTEKTAEPRFPNFKGIMAAKKKPVDHPHIRMPVSASIAPTNRHSSGSTTSP